jgi:sugar lactone lactonase YvrE
MLISRSALPRHFRYSSLLAFGVALGCSGPSDEKSCSGDGVICAYTGDGVAGLGKDGVEPLEVSLYLPQDLTIGPDGQPYILDWNNHRVRTIVDGRVQTIIGTGQLGDAPDGLALGTSLNHPTHIVFDAQDRLVLSAWHNSKMLRYDSATLSVEGFCGDGRRDYAGDGGPAELAALDLPVAAAFDPQGQLLIMDQANQRIRRIDENGIINTVVGPGPDLLPVPQGYARVCQIDATTGLETCKLCDPLVADDPNCPARKPQGFYGDGGPATEALMFQPFSQSAPPAGRLDMGPDGTLYFCDTGNHRIRAVALDGVIRTVAGSGPAEFDKTFAGGYAGDGGLATQALLARPTDVAVSAQGQLFIADTSNNCIRKVDTQGVISTVAGRCGERGFDGDGSSATEALLDRPYGVALDALGNLYIADTHNHRIRIVYGVE